MHHWLRTGFVLLLVGITVTGLFTPAAAADYSVTMESGQTIELPAQPVDYEGNSITVDSIGVVQADSPFTVGYSIPEDAVDDTDLSVRDAGGDTATDTRQENKELSTSGSWDVDGLAPGTYAVVMQAPVGIPDLQAIVVEGYDMSGDIADTTVTQSDETTVTVSEITQTTQSADSINSVDIAVGNTLENREVATATDDNNDGTYEATVEFDSLDPGSYPVYATIRSDDEVSELDRNEAMALKRIGEVEVTDTEDESTDSSDPSGSTGGGTSGTTDTEETESADLTATDDGAPSVSDTTTTIDESIEVSAEYQNTGDAAVLEEAHLLVNGSAVASQEITATSGGTAAVEFEHTFSDPGEYALAIESETLGTQSVATVAVSPDDSSSTESPSSEGDSSSGDQAAEESQSSEESDTEQETQSSTGTPGFGAGAALIATLMTAVLLHRRQ